MADKKRVFTVLSIDGGGVRGIIPARILQEIEERTGKPISELFDMIGGTSTGAIVAGSLVTPDPKDPKKPKFSAKDVLKFYHDLAPKVFPEIRFKLLRKLSSSALYDPKPFEDALLDNFGDLQMKDTLTSLLIPVTDIKHFKPAWITHLKGQKDNSKEGWSTMLLRDAVRATGSAPTFFPAKYYETTPNPEMPNVKHRHALIDGSFFGGNTLRHLMTQAQKLAPADAEIVIVHVGTGNSINSVSPEEFNAMGTLGLISPANGSILLSLIVDMGMIDVQNDMKDEIGERFFSFDGEIDLEENADSPSISLDDARPENLKRLEKLAEKIIQNNDDDIGRLCSVLKDRKFAEERHLESLSALQKLNEMMADARTVKGLMRIYLKIVHYSSGIDNVEHVPSDKEIKELSGKLSDHHKSEIDRLYRVLLDKKQHESKILNTIKEAGEDITSITKKIFVEPFQEPPPPDNDNKPPVPPVNEAPKRNTGKKPGP